MPSKFNKILDKVWKILIRFVKSSKKFHQENYLTAGQQQAKKLLLPPSKDQFFVFCNDENLDMEIGLSQNEAV